ncbi:MAG: hypothetical protein KF873_08095 [Gemmataceae bacterium]|nr:hypothetical protein [Gemmataceae bacterium]
MTLRRLFALASALLLASFPAAAAEGEFDRSGAYVTTNFRVTAPSKDLAEKFGDMAEHYRREKAMEWLGETMPNWNQRCPLKVEIRMKDAGGATTFTFGSAGGRGGVLSQSMHIFGEQKQLLESVLPHEVTHTVLAYHFGQAVPRWADEGGSVLSENENECFEHDIRCRQILNGGRGIKLRVLLTLKEYPRDMIVVYAQGYSICDYLINQHGGRAKFLKFVRTGMKNDNRNWEAAVRDVYGFESVDELEEKWIDSLRTPPQRVAKGKASGTTALASRAGGGGDVDVRMSGLSGVPKLEAPIVHRGAAPDREVREDRRPATKPASRVDDRPPPIALLLPPEYTPKR